MKNTSPWYALAREFALFTHRSLFLTGKAGTGKTTFLRNLHNETRKQMAIVAPTGVAAIHAGGSTIHSFFQLPFTPFAPTVAGRKELIEKMKMNARQRKVIQELELLVIDEISMVRADILDAIDTVLRHIRYNFSEPFGGVQMLLIGDMFQLSPVALDTEWRILSEHYSSPYFFQSQVIKQHPPVYIEFDTIFRQTSTDFIRVLNQVRNNCLTAHSQALLESRYDPTFRPAASDTYVTLTTHNYKADRINTEELANIKSAQKLFTATIKGDFPEKNDPTDRALALKVDAKVIFIKNDTDVAKRFYNGKIGIVRKLTDDKVWIACAGEDEWIEVGKMTWQNIRYSTNETTRQIEEEVVGTFEQLPVRLAWAITIHKSQGLTFEKAIIDAGDAFASGQVYVALSRCRSLEGVVLRSKINPGSIENNREIVAHEKQKPALEELENQLNLSRQHFRAFVLTKLFDFKSAIGQCARLKRETETVAASFNDETLPFLKNCFVQLQQLQEVAEKFQSQLKAIFTSAVVDENYLSERIAAATNYYDEKLENLLETIAQSPATTDSRQHARDFTDQLRSIYAGVALKKHILEKLTSPFDVENYFQLKNSFVLSSFTLNAYANTSSNLQANMRHPKLYAELMELRNRICEPRNLPIYIVAGTKTITEMAELLPLTSTDLLKIHGFGPAKAEKYGEQFLELIRNYCTQHGLDTNMAEKQLSAKNTKKAAKEKKATKLTSQKQKGNSQHESLVLFKSGKSIEYIADQRGLAVSTICSHLSQMVDAGQLHINELISNEKIEKATQLTGQASPSASYQILSSVLTPIEINFFISHRRNKYMGAKKKLI